MTMLLLFKAQNSFLVPASLRHRIRIKMMTVRRVHVRVSLTVLYI